jgi:hypothetical protein
MLLIQMRLDHPLCLHDRDKQNSTFRTPHHLVTPTSEDESEHIADWDAANYSIKTTRGEAMHAVMSYALWVYRNTDQDSHAGDYSTRRFNQMPEVEVVLDKHLGPNIDSSAAIRSVYGQWFPWLVLLDPNWADGECYRNGEKIASGFVESAINQVVSKRMVKKQQMGWSQRRAHLLLQI